MVERITFRSPRACVRIRRTFYINRIPRGSRDHYKPHLVAQHTMLGPYTHDGTSNRERIEPCLQRNVRLTEFSGPLLAFSRDQPVKSRVRSFKIGDVWAVRLLKFNQNVDKARCLTATGNRLDCQYVFFISQWVAHRHFHSFLCLIVACRATYRLGQGSKTNMSYPVRSVGRNIVDVVGFRI